MMWVGFAAGPIAPKTRLAIPACMSRTSVVATPAASPPSSATALISRACTTPPYNRQRPGPAQRLRFSHRPGAAAAIFGASGGPSPKRSGDPPRVRGIVIAGNHSTRLGRGGFSGSEAAHYLHTFTRESDRITVYEQSNQRVSTQSGRHPDTRRIGHSPL